MLSAHPSLQVVPPAEPVVEIPVVAEPVVEVAPAEALVQQPPSHAPVDIEQETLTDEQLKNYWTHGSTEGPSEQERAQVNEVQDFFDTTPKEPEVVVEPAAPGVVDPTVVPVVQEVQPQVGVPLAPAAPVAPAVPAVPAAPSPNEAALQAQVQNLQTQMAGLIGQMQAPVAAQAQTVPETPAAPQFNMQIPPQHMEALASEDPSIRMQAMNSIINGTAAVAQQQTMALVEQRLENFTPYVQQQVHVETENNRISADMYGTYPELNTDQLRRIVAAHTEQLQATNPAHAQWGPDLRDAIAERMAPMVPGMQERVNANRAARGILPQVPQQNVLPQVQVPQGLPAGVVPAGVVGGAHTPAPAVQPAGQSVYVRDASGQLVLVAPHQQQTIAGGAQARPATTLASDRVLQDIHSTFGYT